MKVTRVLTLATMLCAAPLVGVAGTNDAQENVAPSQQKSCCFENPRFSGTCEVTPGPEESCSSILAYLNNPNSVGKNYCGNTKVRGGWSQVRCEGTGASTRSVCVSRAVSTTPPSTAPSPAATHSGAAAPTTASFNQAPPLG